MAGITKVHRLEDLNWETGALYLYNKGTTQITLLGKGACQGCILSPCLFNLYVEYIMGNARLDEAQAGIKIARRNINNLRYTDDTIPMGQSKEELKVKRTVKKLA